MVVMTKIKSCGQTLLARLNQIVEAIDCGPRVDMQERIRVREKEAATLKAQKKRPRVGIQYIN